MRPKLRHSGANSFAGWDMRTLLDNQASLRKDHPFIVWEPFEGAPKTWTYGEFGRESAQLATGLAARGVKQGDFVLVHLENCPEFLLAWAACARLGAVAVTTNTRSAGEELAYYADNAGVSAAITQPKFAELVAASCKGLRFMAVTASDAGDSSSAANSRDLPFEDLFAAAVDVPPREPDPMAPLCVMYTSGTTSRPKGVVWTHANGLWAGRAGTFHEGLLPEDIYHVILPLFHMNGMSLQFLSTLWVGGTLVVQPRFSASRFWDVAVRNKCTYGSVIPFVVSALAEQEVPDHHFRNWGLGVNGVLDEQFGVRTMGWWGMTETVTVGITGSLLHNDTPAVLGRPSPLYEIAIVGPDGQGVQPGQTGDLRIKGMPGISLFDHYLNNEQATEESFDEHGFFMTGDLARLNEDGTMSFQDRSKDMLKVGGENVAASEVERVINLLDQVSESAVVAKPDKMLNEVPVAFVIAKAGADLQQLEADINAACNQALADFKRPREVRFVAEMPRSNLEKIAKVQLRDQLAAEV